MVGRNSPRFLSFAALAVALGLAARSGAQPVAPFIRVRSVDPTIGSLLAEGLARSRTLRDLVERIEVTDGFVYVQPGRCPETPACLMHHVGGNDRHRYLRSRVTLSGLSFANQRVVTVSGLHFVQEDCPDEIGRAIAAWLT